MRRITDAAKPRVIPIKHDGDDQLQPVTDAEKETFYRECELTEALAALNEASKDVWT
jgi:hypothetical protein